MCADTVGVVIDVLVAIPSLAQRVQGGAQRRMNPILAEPGDGSEADKVIWLDLAKAELAEKRQGQGAVAPDNG